MMHQNDDFDLASNPRPGPSHWTKRRKIVQSVDEIMSQISNSDGPDVTAEQGICATNEAVSDVSHSPDQRPLMDQIPNQNCDSATASDPFLTSRGFEEHFGLEMSSESDVSDVSSLSSDDYALSDKLSVWAVNHNIPKDALSDLLHLLNPHVPGLPLDARTLLKSANASKYNLKVITHGSYCHFGVLNGIKKLVDDGLEISSGSDDVKCLQLQVNVDGLPVYKSTNYQLWPILGMVVNTCDKMPFVIGMFGGYKKPGSVLEYLHDFVEECHVLEENGILLGGDVYSFKIHSILCDAPARAFVRNTKGHNAYYGCDRCTQAGKWLNKITYPEVSATKRTDASFRSKANEEHHIGDSPLIGLSVDLISQLPLDYMHLVCLGVMRRLILAWLKGPLNCRLPAKSVSDISERLGNFRSYVPSEFSRQPRTLSDIDRFKATEFRQLLLYTGIVAFRNILPDRLYSHFMLLSCAIYCCLSPLLCHAYCAYANKLLISFVQYAGKVYGPEFLVYNVHSLVHITDDVQNFGALDAVSCFPFENHLRIIKKSIRSSFLPFQQIIGRLSEMQHLKQSKSTGPTPHCSSEHSSGPVADYLSDCQQFRTVVTKDFKLSSSCRDSCILTENRSVGIVRNILRNNAGDILLVLTLYGNTESLYTYPISSSQIDVYSVADMQMSFTVVPLSQVFRKCVRLPLDKSRFAVIPLLHHSE